MKPFIASSTRREFFRTSLLAGATAALAAESALPPTAAAQPGRAADAPSPGPRCPLCPYGSGEPIHLTDLDRCQPASALAPAWTARRWRLMPYESSRLRGMMAVAGTNTPVPELGYPFRQRGWFAISLGLLSVYNESRLQVRLKGDSAFSLLTVNKMIEEGIDWNQIQYVRHLYDSKDPDGSRAIEEYFWKCALLDEANSSLVIRQLQVQTVPGHPEIAGNAFFPCWLAYIKLVPLTSAEVEAVQADRRQRETRRLFVHDDAFDAPCFLHYQNEGDIRRQVEPYRDGDFARLYWEAAMGELTHYPSKVGRLMTMQWEKDMFRMDDRILGEFHSDFQARGIDPFRVALESCHALGMEFHAAYRVAGFLFPPPEDEWNAGGVYQRHPEWRGRDRLGAEMPRLSYVYPEVREFVYSLMEEIAAYPVDGIAMLYNRRLPVIGYEAPLVDSFRRQYGLDPRALPEDDERWLAHSAAVLTEFMRELRRRMRAVEARRRRPVDITAVVMSSRRENYGNALDVEAWVKEGLIDTVVGYNDRISPEEERASAEYFVGMTKNTSCRCALNLMPRYLPPEEYKRRADDLYRAGVDHLFFWDSHKRINFDASWSAIRRLGHKQELADWRARGGPKVERVTHPLSRLGTWNLSYVTPG